MTKEETVGILLINTPNPPICWQTIDNFQVVSREAYNFATIDYDVHADMLDEVTCVVNNTLLKIFNSSSSSMSYMTWSITPKNDTWEMTFNDSEVFLLIECTDTTGLTCQLERSLAIKEHLQLPYK